MAFRESAAGPSKLPSPELQHVGKLPSPELEHWGFDDLSQLGETYQRVDGIELSKRVVKRAYGLVPSDVEDLPCVSLVCRRSPKRQSSLKSCRPTVDNEETESEPEGDRAKSSLPHIIQLASPSVINKALQDSGRFDDSGYADSVCNERDKPPWTS